MRLGMLARSEHRGLGNMTREFYRHMQPEKTLVVIPSGVPRHGLVSHLDWYPDGQGFVSYDGTLPEDECKEWLVGLDVVYSAETFYDWRFCQWARDLGVATVCHAMPEWLPRLRSAEPSAWWAPTSWRIDRLPEGTNHVPVPIPTDRFTPSHRQGSTFRWLHIAGAQTHADRNGTDALMRAARQLKEPQELVIRSQTHGIGYGEVALNVTLCNEGSTEDYWTMYEGVDAMAMPRRYAGLSLPVLEAMGAGLPIVMTDLSPQNTDWPVALIPTIGSGFVQVNGRDIFAADADPTLLARTMDEWVANPETVEGWRDKSKEYAKATSWDVMADRYRELFAEIRP